MTGQNATLAQQVIGSAAAIKDAFEAELAKRDDSGSETSDGAPLGADGRPLGEHQFRQRALWYGKRETRKARKREKRKANKAWTPKKELTY